MTLSMLPEKAYLLYQGSASTPVISFVQPVCIPSSPIFLQVSHSYQTEQN